MRVIKTGWRNKLNEKNLSSLLYINTEGPTLQDFDDNLPSVFDFDLDMEMRSSESEDEL